MKSSHDGNSQNQLLLPPALSVCVTGTIQVLLNHRTSVSLGMGCISEENPTTPCVPHGTFLDPSHDHAVNGT